MPDTTQKNTQHLDVKNKKNITDHTHM